MKKKMTAFLLALVLSLSIAGCTTQSPAPQPLPDSSASYDASTIQPEQSSEPAQTGNKNTSATPGQFNFADLPEYSESYYEVNGNQPYFTEADMTTEAFETYSDLDSLGRCGVAYANICKEIMPTEERQAINSVTPSGWVQASYPDLKLPHVMERCHLIGFQLAGENDNEKNLVSGTHYFNVSLMLPFENMVADYVKETDNHVLYRVTPIFVNDELMPRGVLMEAYSVEDDGDGICFNVFCYNVQPGLVFNYTTGTSKETGVASVKSDDDTTTSNVSTAADTKTYVLNTRSLKFHTPDCSSISKIAEYNKEEETISRSELIAEGYEPCGICKP